MNILLIKSRITMKTKVNLFIVTLITVLFYGCNIKPFTPNLSEDDVIKTTVKALSIFEVKTHYPDKYDLYAKIDTLCAGWEKIKGDSTFQYKLEGDIVCLITPITMDDQVLISVAFGTLDIANGGRPEAMRLYNKMRQMAYENQLIAKNVVAYNRFDREHGYFYQTTEIKTDEWDFEDGVLYRCTYELPVEYTKSKMKLHRYRNLPKYFANEEPIALPLLRELSEDDKKSVIEIWKSHHNSDAYVVSLVICTQGNLEEMRFEVRLCEEREYVDGYKLYTYGGKNMQGDEVLINCMFDFKSISDYLGQRQSRSDFPVRVQTSFEMDKLVGTLVLDKHKIPVTVNPDEPRVNLD